jgi:hypothetical protein
MSVLALLHSARASDARVSVIPSPALAWDSRAPINQIGHERNYMGRQILGGESIPNRRSEWERDRVSRVCFA